MRILMTIAFFLWSFSASANENLLIGSWDGDDTASMSIYGTLKISEQLIAWDKNNNYQHDCKLGYQIQNEDFGVSFENVLGKKYVTAPDSEFISYLLKITSDNCATGIGSFRLTFPQKNDATNLEMIEYDQSGNANGFMQFHKRQ